MALQMREYPLDGAARIRDRVETGSVVTLQQLGKRTRWDVTVVGTHQADPESDRISDQCPIGEALLGRRAGDIIVVVAPAGVTRYRILSVRRREDAREQWR